MIDEQVDPNDPIARLLAARYNANDEAAAIDAQLEPVARMLDGDAAGDELALARSLVASDPSLAAAMREISHQDAGNVVGIGDRTARAPKTSTPSPRRWLYAVAAVAVATLGALYMTSSSRVAGDGVGTPTMGAAIGGTGVARVGWDASSGVATVAGGGATTLNVVVVSDATPAVLRAANRPIGADLVTINAGPVTGECRWLVAVLTATPFSLDPATWTAAAKTSDGTCAQPTSTDLPTGAETLVQRLLP